MKCSLCTASRATRARFSASRSPAQRPAQQTRTRCLPDKRAEQAAKKQDESSATSVEATVQLRATQPVVLPIFMFANLAVYGTGIAIALLMDGETSNQFFFAFAKMNDQVAAGQYYRIITATFMHAGLLHLASNSLALWYIGLEAEAVYGYSYFAAIYLLSGTAGNIASFMVDDLVTVGASGAIFGLLGAVAAYFFRNPNLERSRMQLVFLFGLVTLNIALGTVEGTLVDNTGHVAGFLSGLWLGWNTCPVWKVDSSTSSDGGSSSTSFKQAAVVIHSPEPDSDCESEPVLTPSVRDPPTGTPTHASAEVLDTQASLAPVAVTATASEAAASASSTGQSQASSSGAQSETTKSIDFLDALVPEPKQEASNSPVGQDAEPPAAVEALGASSRQGEKAVEVVPMRDTSSTAIGMGVLISFTMSMGLLTWAGVVVRVAEKGL